jgi:hypothetical protein
MAENLDAEVAGLFDEDPETLLQSLNQSQTLTGPLSQSLQGSPASTQAIPSPGQSQTPANPATSRPVQQFQHREYREAWPLLLRQAVRDLQADSRLHQEFCSEAAQPIRAQLELVCGDYAGFMPIADELYDRIGRSVWQPIAAAKSPRQMARYSSASLFFASELVSAEAQRRSEEALFASLRRHSMVLVPEPSRRLFTSLLLRSIFDVAMLAKADRMGASLHAEMETDAAYIRTDDHALVFVSGYVGAYLKRGAFRFPGNAQWAQFSLVSICNFFASLCCKHFASLCKGFQMWPCLFTSDPAESGLEEDCIRWATAASRGGLLFPLSPTFDFFKLLTERLATTTLAQLQPDEFWDQFLPGMVEMTRAAILRRVPDATDFPFLERFSRIAMAVFRRVYMGGLARAQRDRARETESSLRHQAGLSTYREEANSDSDSDLQAPVQQTADFQALASIPVGSRNLPLRQDLARRASLQIASETDSLDVGFSFDY